MTKTTSLFFFCTLAALLSGCANDSVQQVNLNLRYLSTDSMPTNTRDTNAEAQIADASRAIEKSLQSLSAIELANHPDVKVEQAINEGPLGKQASLEWNGTVAPAVKQIAKAAGFTLRILGAEPPVPVLINIHVTESTLGNILQNIAYQAAPNIQLKVNKKQKRITLTYLGQ